MQEVTSSTLVFSTSSEAVSGTEQPVLFYLNFHRMKVDLYTKTVLTVIAVCLVVLTLHQVSVVPRAYAVPATANSGYDLKPNYDGSINVRLIDISTLSRALPVSLESIPPYDKIIKVQVENSYIYTKLY